MKQLFSFSFILFTTLFLHSCDNDSPESSGTTNPVAGLKKIQDFTDNNYTISAYNEKGEWRLGYTKVYFTIEDKNGELISNAALKAFPEMDMGTMAHSTPHSEIKKVEGKALYEADYAFLMYSGQSDGTWYYDLEYQIGNSTGSILRNEINVKNVFRPDGVTQRKVIQSLLAIDGSEKRYVVTLIEPQKPKVGLNDITAYIHERKDANTYFPVENFTLKLDPRMPSMENHSSPNNVDLTWDVTDETYKGKVNFSMTGYWILNLILLNEENEVLYGNTINDRTETSSLYFEIEF